MKTINPKQLKNTERKWYMIDAEGQNLGRLSTKVAVLLRGKDRVDFASNVDNGSYVVVLNADKIALTWSKEEDKLYYTHSGFMGGIKVKTASEMRTKKGTDIIKLAVKWMLPKNKLRDDMLSRLKLQLDWNHKYEAQKPELIKL